MESGLCRAFSSSDRWPIRRESQSASALLSVPGHHETLSPDIQEIYLNSLKSFGIDPLDHDIRFVEDDWESPTLGAWGLGWEVWLDGMEITQFTYFQQAGGIELNPIPVEITYGIERIAMYLQGVDNVFDLEWTKGVRYGDVHHRGRGGIFEV